MSDVVRSAGRRRWIGLATAVVVALIVGAAGLVAGLLLRDPNAAQLRSATEAPVAEVFVETRTMTSAITVQGQAVAGSGLDVPSPAAVADGRAVVTDAAVRAGDPAPSGTYLGSVNGRPLFSLQIDPLPYRNLQARDSGPDVVALQRALTELGYATNDDGWYGTETARALRNFYVDRDQAPPGGATAEFVLREFATHAEGYPVVASIAARNSILDSEDVFVRLRTSPNVVQARVNLLEAKEFHIDDEVHVRGGDIDVMGVVVEVGDFVEPSEQNDVAGVDVTVSVTPEVELLIDQPYTVTTLGEEDTGPALPLSALRQHDGVVSVLIESNGLRSEVPVTVLGESGGWVRIADDPLLPVGAVAIVE